MMLTPRQLYTYALCSCAFCYLSSAICFLSSTTVESALQIRLFMQNKANFQKSQMNVSCCLTMNYEQRTMNYEIKNKADTNPIQSQYKANTNPIQSQNKPNTKPKQTQFKPKQSQFKPNTKPIRTQFKPKQTQFLSAICVAGQTQSRTYPGRRLSNGLGASLCNRILEVKQMVESQDRCGAKMEYLDLAKLK